eukprot:59533_1
MIKPNGMKNINTNISPHPRARSIQAISHSPPNTDAFMTDDHVLDETPTDDRNDPTMHYVNQPSITPIPAKWTDRSRNRKRPVLYSYSPHRNYRSQYYPKMTTDFTETIFKDKVSQSIANVFPFVNKSTSMVHCDNNAVDLNNQSSLIYNYGLYDKQTGEPLFCIADKNRSKNNKCYYEMRDELFTEQDIGRMGVGPPLSSCHPDTNVYCELTKSFEHQLSNCIMGIIPHCKWNRVRVFNC